MFFNTTFETVKKEKYLIISKMWVNCSKLLVLNRIRYFGENTCSLTDALVLKRKIFYLFDLVQTVYVNHVNIEDRSQPTARGISLIYSKNNKSPRMDPCRTPYLNSAVVENLS